MNKVLSKAYSRFCREDIIEGLMKDIIIKEALPEDAEARIAYSKQVGSETDNLSFGKE